MNKFGVFFSPSSASINLGRGSYPYDFNRLEYISNFPVGVGNPLLPSLDKSPFLYFSYLNSSDDLGK